MNDTSDPWPRLLDEDLDRLRGASLLRRRRVVRPLDATRVEIDGRVLLNFASNDYLGLTHHPEVIAAAGQALERDGAGSGAAPLVSGFTPAHASAEAALARWKGTEAAVLLPSGYQANVAAVQTIAAVANAGGKKVRFLLDKLCHASLLDAVRATGEPFRVFPHNHLPKLERLLEDEGADRDSKDWLDVVVTESIFSMDGEAADLAGLARLKRERPFVLLLDEAHGSGVYGPNGSGYAAECGLQDVVDVTVVTLSKALGCAGGAVCGPQALCDSVVNRGRAYLFSTSMPPASAAAVVAAVDVIAREPQRQARLRRRAEYVRRELRDAGFDLPAGDSPIVPIVFGSEQAALAAADRLRGEGLFVVAIRPPTVPRGTSRLRITLSSEHADGDVSRLIAAVRALRPEAGPQ